MRELAARLRRIGPGRIALAALLLAGLALRIVAFASLWPTSAYNADSGDYAAHAAQGLLQNPYHPAGYSIFLWAIGLLTRQAVAPIFVQSALGIASALLLYAATRRVTGSRAPALVGAGMLLLDADQIYLEHQIMAETLAVALLVGAMYAAVRAFDEPAPWWRWPALAGLLAAVSTIVRTTDLFVVPVIALALWCSCPIPWRARLRPAAAVLGTAAVALLVYALANAAANGHFQLSPASGWRLYGRVAPFADCRAFTPPAGTRALCESRPVAQRPGPDFYLFDPTSPAWRAFGSFGHHDDKLMAFALAVIEHQPGTFLSSSVREMRAYFVPSSHPYVTGWGIDIDPALDWTQVDDPHYVPATHAQMEQFFSPFDIDRSKSGLQFLHDYQHPFRFGATLLTLCTLASLLGLLIGERRARAAVLLFAGSGLALLVLPTLWAYYTGRYAEPVAGPLAVGAAISLWSLWRLEAERRRAAS